MPDFDKFFSDYGNIVKPALTVLAALVLFMIWFFSTQDMPSVNVAEDNVATTVQSGSTEMQTFRCQSGKTIKALISANEAQLELSDGREIIIPRSGSQYANPDGSFIFSRAGNAATIREGGRTTYTC